MCVKRYYVTYRINARYVTEVFAENIEGAKKLAEDVWCDADFGEAQDIEGKPIMVEDENGNYVWER